MNTTEDGQPVGEAPEVSPIRLMLDAADRITATVELAERQTQAIELIRQTHVKSPYPRYSFTGGSSCHSCNDVWPCPTIRILDEAGA